MHRPVPPHLKAAIHELQSQRRAATAAATLQQQTSAASDGISGRPQAGARDDECRHASDNGNVHTNRGSGARVQAGAPAAASATTEREEVEQRGGEHTNPDGDARKAAAAADGIAAAASCEVLGPKWL